MKVWIVYMSTNALGGDYTQSIVAVFSNEAAADICLVKKLKEYDALGLLETGDNSKTGDYDYCKKHGVDCSGAQFWKSAPIDVLSEWKEPMNTNWTKAKDVRNNTKVVYKNKHGKILSNKSLQGDEVVVVEYLDGSVETVNVSDLQKL